MKIQVKRLVQFAAAATLAAAFVIGTAGIGEAAKKKAAKVATPAPAPYCWTGKAPVCATKGKLNFTYANACYASNDGAKIVYNGACKPPKKAKKAKKGKAKKAAKK